MPICLYFMSIPNCIFVFTCFLIFNFVLSLGRAIGNVKVHHALLHVGTGTPSCKEHLSPRRKANKTYFIVQFSSHDKKIVIATQASNS